MFRVTISQSLASTQLELNRRSVAAAKLQADLSSGVRIRRASDDPRGIQIVLNQRAGLEQLKTQVRSIGDARSRLEHAHQQILDAQQILVKAHSLTLQARQSTEPTERQIMAVEVDRMLESLMLLANTRHEGTPLFAGADLNGAAFQQTGPGGSVRYTGSQIPGQVRLDDGLVVDVLYSGASIFQPGGRGETLLTGSTGAAGGTGTSSARGIGQLLVQHTATLISGASGVQPGVSSPGGDTILGASGTHTLTIEDTSGVGAFGTVSLNGGPAINFTSTETDLRVTGPGGEIVFLDLSNVTAGFSGTVDLTGQGTLSIDGGLTQTAINFTSGQGLIDSRDGAVTYIDSQGITRTGEEVVEYSGTFDVFQVLGALRDELRNVNGLSEQELQASLGRRLGDLDRLGHHLLTVVAEQSTALEQFNHLQARAEDMQLAVQQRLLDTEGTDYAATTIALQEQQTWMQFSLATLVRLFDISVLNYL